MADIRKVDNGYITITGITATERIHATIEDAFNWLLLTLEGKSKSFGGKSYGCVKVIYDTPADEGE